MYRFFLSIVFFSLYQCAFSAPEIDVKTKHYSVYGHTDTEIRNYMTARSPAMAKGRKYDAFTSWRVKWRFSYEEDDDMCYLSDIETEVKVTITMPKLETLRFIPQKIQSDWETYYAALTEHENGHRDYGIEAINAIDDALHDLDGEKTCDLMKETANNVAHGILKKYIKREKEYDRDTKHGQTQGAYFPR